MRNVDLAELTDTERILNVLLKKEGRVNASFPHSSVFRFLLKQKLWENFTIGKSQLV